VISYIIFKLIPLKKFPTEASLCMITLDILFMIAKQDKKIED